MADNPKLATRHKLEEDPDVEKCQNCNTPGHDEENCYSGVNMENCRPKWTQPKPRKRLLKTTNKPNNQKWNDNNNPLLRI